MKSVFWKWTTVLVVGTLAAWFGVKFLLPVALPFLLGGLLALAAEPAVSWGTEQLKMPRIVASILGIGLSLLILMGILFALGGIVFQRLGMLAQNLPDLPGALQTAEDSLLSLTENAPPMLRTLAQRTIQNTLQDGSGVISQVTQALLGAVSTLVGGVAGSALNIGTGILAAFLISLRLPRLQQLSREKLPDSWRSNYLPALLRMRHSLWGWLKAQTILCLVTWGILSLGFWLLGIGKAPLWAFFIALVDAVPVLGTGTVLLPWSVVSLLRGQTARGLGLLAVYGTALLTRTVLEPKVLGKNLGLDPLLTLVTMYAGYRFWGVGGLLLTPILASAVKTAFFPKKTGEI